MLSTNYKKWLTLAHGRADISPRAHVGEGEAAAVRCGGDGEQTGQREAWPEEAARRAPRATTRKWLYGGAVRTGDGRARRRRRRRRGRTDRVGNGHKPSGFYQPKPVPANIKPAR